MENQPTQESNVNQSAKKLPVKFGLLITIVVICLIVVTVAVCWWREKIKRDDYFNSWGTYLSYKLGWKDECKGAGMMVLKNQRTGEIKKFDPFCSVPPWYKHTEWSGFIAVE